MKSNVVLQINTTEALKMPEQRGKTGRNCSIRTCRKYAVLEKDLKFYTLPKERERFATIYSGLISLGIIKCIKCNRYEYSQHEEVFTILFKFSDN